MKDELPSLITPDAQAGLTLAGQWQTAFSLKSSKPTPMWSAQAA